MRRSVGLLSALVFAVVVAALAPATAEAQTSGGPVVLMGIDAENGGPGGHGPPATYTRLVNNILAQVTKPAAEVVVVGCKPGTGTGNFWAAVFPAHRCVTGGPAILAETFLTARLVAVVSDQPETPDGGLRCADEDPALDDPSTQAEIAAHVNAGGGLLGFSSLCPRPYQYIAGLFEISVGARTYSNIDPTTEGNAIGVDNTLDVFAWHQVFLTFPTFLNVLAFRSGSSEAAAIGGRKVEVPPPLVPTTLQLTPDSREDPVDTVTTYNALVQDQFGNNMRGVEVTFNVMGASGDIRVRHTTDQDGVATLQYQGPPLPGQDTIRACVEQDPPDNVCDPADQPTDAPSIQTWILPVSTPNCAVDMNKETGGGQIIAANGDKFAFGGNAQVGPQGDTRGEQEARDFGPMEEFSFHGNVIAVICEAANPTLGTPGRATIFATGTDSGSLTGIARIDVQDFGEPGSGATDTYRFRPGGFGSYDTGVQPLKSGNIQIHKS